MVKVHLKMMFVATLLSSPCIGAQPLSSFGTAQKGCYRAPTNINKQIMDQHNWTNQHTTDGCTGWPMDTEVPVFHHSCATEGKSFCMMSHFWSGGNWPGYQNTRLRYYVDGEKTASIDFPIGLGHGSLMVDNDGPWSAGGIFGKTGQPSGLFNTYAIPFVNVTVTVELKSNMTLESERSVSFWIVLRGHTHCCHVNIPGSSITLDFATLNKPPRLHTQEIVHQVVQPGEQLALFNSTINVGGTGGLVFMVALAVESQGGETFLEGCFRGYTSSGDLKLLMSSGTEDYFLGTYYFNKGKYMLPISGLTHLDTQGKTTTFSAYRLHTDDPLAYPASEGLSVTWRNGDPEGCDITATPRAPVVSVSSVVFFYEY